MDKQTKRLQRLVEDIKDLLNENTKSIFEVLGVIESLKVELYYKTFSLVDEEQDGKNNIN